MVICLFLALNHILPDSQLQGSYTYTISPVGQDSHLVRKVIDR